MSNVEEYKKLKKIHSLANRIYEDSSLSDEEKYSLIFSEKISRFVFNFFEKIKMKLDYYDPDTSYKEDVKAFLDALNDKMEHLNSDKNNSVMEEWLNL